MTGGKIRNTATPTLSQCANHHELKANNKRIIKVNSLFYFYHSLPVLLTLITKMSSTKTVNRYPPAYLM